MDLPSLNVADFLALIIICLGTFIGYKRGISGELARLASIVGAFALGLFLYRPFGNWLTQYTKLSHDGTLALAFIVTIIASIVVMVAIRVVLKRILKVVIEEESDKFGGALAGFLRSIIQVLILFVAMNLIPNDYMNRLFGDESAIGSIVKKFVPKIEEKITETLEDKDLI